MLISLAPHLADRQTVKAEAKLLGVKTLETRFEHLRCGTHPLRLSDCLMTVVPSTLSMYVVPTVDRP